MAGWKNNCWCRYYCCWCRCCCCCCFGLNWERRKLRKVQIERERNRLLLHYRLNKRTRFLQTTRLPDVLRCVVVVVKKVKGQRSSIISGVANKAVFCLSQISFSYQNWTSQQQRPPFSYCFLYRSTLKHAEASARYLMNKPITRTATLHLALYNRNPRLSGYCIEEKWLAKMHLLTWFLACLICKLDKLPYRAMVLASAPL